MSTGSRRLTVLALPLVVLTLVVIGSSVALQLQPVDGSRPPWEPPDTLNDREPILEYPDSIDQAPRDYWVTVADSDGRAGGTYQNVTIPAGFFGPGCDEFDGRIEFMGSPLDPATMGNVDTVLKRSADPISRRAPIGTVATVDLTLEELSLVATEPIAVLCDGMPEQWDVHAGLSSRVPPRVGSLTATKTHANGGVFDSTIYVQVVLTFTNVADPGKILVLDTGGVSDPIELTATNTRFVHEVDPAMGWALLRGQVMGEFIAGIDQPNDDDSGLYTVDRTTHEGPEHAHNACPPVGACCDNEGDCAVMTQAACTGSYKGDGTVCGPTGACCLPDESCEVMAEICCEAPNEFYGGPCDPNPCVSYGGGPPRMPYGGKFRRVDIHGVPMPNRSPTGEGEDDRLPNMAYIDMYDLAPMYSVTDVAVPVEGGELTLEFRRTSGIRSFRHSTDVRKQGITYPSNSILGLGWDTNLASRAIVAFDPDEDDPTKDTTARVMDEVGNSYPYFDNGQTGEGNPFAPDVVHSFVNDSVRAKLFRQDANTLVLIKVFGTRLTYEKVGRFTPPDPSNSDRWEDYYRLAHIEDRNGNRLEYVYTGSDPNDRLTFLVAEIHEAAHPERKLQFSYTLGSGPNGVDRGDRLNKVTDPLGRETSFTFGQAWNLLLEVKREAVPDAENGGAIVQPSVTFSYHAVELPVEETETPPTMPTPDPTTKNRYVGLGSITDARGHVTTFSYITDFFPSTFAQYGRTFYQKKIRLTGASTVDGPVVLTQVIRTGEHVITKSQDTRGNTAKYDFVAQRLPADNKFGVAIYVTDLTRTSEALPSDNTAVFQWTPDPFANLVHVVDMNANTIDYTYGNLASQQSNQPTLRTITDTGSSETIVTTYEYGAFSKMTRLVDGEAKETTYTLDGNGNRTHVNEELGKTTLYQYASDGFVEQITDPDGRVTTFSRSFNSGDLNRHYTLISTVTGYSGELNLDTETVSDVSGSAVEITDPEENVYTHEYDALYRRTRTTNPAVEESPGGPLVTSTREYTYTLNGAVIEEKDDLGNVTVSVFDPMNRPTETRRRMTDPASNDDTADLITVNTYNPVGLVETTTDPNGNLTFFDYDALLRLSQKTFDANVLAYVETYEYGNNAGSGAFVYTGGWQPTRVINRRGFAQDITYDGFYRPVKSIRRQTDGSGIPHDDPPAPNELATYTTCNRVHNVVATTVLAEAEAGGDSTTYTFYDDLHRPTISLLDFDGDGNDSTAYTPEATYVNNAAAFSAHDGEDFVTRAVYDLAGNVTKAIDAEANPTDTTYDGASRVTEVEQAPVAGGRPTTTTAYDDNGNASLAQQMQSPSVTIQTQMTYDARNRLTRTILDLNGDSVFDSSRPGPDVVSDAHYDLVGNVIRTEDPNGNERDMEYDRTYRVIEVRGPPVADAENGGQMTRPATTTEYDKNSNVIIITDPRGVQTKSTYDGLDRVTSITSAFGTPDAVTTTTAYDENDNVVLLSLDNGAAGLQNTNFTVDPFDRQVTETWPGGNLTTVGYYRNDLVRVVTDPKGQKIESDYDRADRPVTSRHRRSDDSIEETRTFTYDKISNVLSATDLSGTTTYTYDAIYRVLTETRADPGETPYTVTSAYDLNSNRTTVTYPQTARTLTSTYDRLDRLTHVMDSVGPKTTTYIYDANSNRLSCTLPNGVVDTFTYDALNRVLTHVSVAGGPNIYSVDYAYDLASNRRTIDETVQGQPTRNLAYNYDNQYRLTSESWQGNSYSYTYDLGGNRLTKTVNGLTTTYAYNVRNEFLTETTSGVTTTYTHDLNGNRTQKTVGGGPTTDYIWDVNDRLVEAKIESATVFQAGYDYRTRRLTKAEGPITTYFRYDGGVSFHEVTGGLTPAVQVEFVRGSGMGGGIGSILYSDRSAAGGSSEFYCYNAVGHTVALTDSLAMIVRSDLYEAFGNIVASSGASLNNRLANTKERDASIQLDNHGYRNYDILVGRYVSRDPMRYVDGLNLYSHTHNNPINHIDPTGLQEAGEDGNDDNQPKPAQPEKPKPKPKPQPTVIIYYDPEGTVGAQGAADQYKKTLSEAGKNVIEVVGKDPQKLKKQVSKIANFEGLIVIGHGLASHTNQLTRDDLKEITPQGGFALLALQSCFSYNVINKDGFVDEAGDLMAKGGLAIVNYRYSTVIGKVGRVNKGIKEWIQGDKDAGDRDAGTYRIQIEYNFVGDVSSVIILGWKYGVWGEASSKGEKGGKGK